MSGDEVHIVRFKYPESPQIAGQITVIPRHVFSPPEFPSLDKAAKYANDWLHTNSKIVTIELAEKRTGRIKLRIKRDTDGRVVRTPLV